MWQYRIHLLAWDLKSIHALLGLLNVGLLKIIPSCIKYMLLIAVLSTSPRKKQVFKLQSTFNLLLSKSIKIMHTSVWLVYKYQDNKKAHARNNSMNCWNMKTWIQSAKTSQGNCKQLSTCLLSNAMENNSKRWAELITYS